MALLYLVPILLVLGIGAVWIFLWALQSGGAGQQRRKRLEAQSRRVVAPPGPAAMPGLSVETEKPKAGQAQATPTQPKRAAGNRPGQ